MMIGTSGFTAIKALNETLKTILNNKHKPVLVTELRVTWVLF